MANASIFAAFERMWQHVVNLVDGKANKNEVVDLHSTQTITEMKTFTNGIKIGDATMHYDEENQRIVISVS